MLRRHARGYNAFGDLVFPENLRLSIAAWLDGRRAAFSDSSGAYPVTAIGGPVRRVDDPPGNWQSSDDAHRPAHDSQGLRAELFSPSGMTRSGATSVSFQNSTIVASFLSRAHTWNTAQGLIVFPDAGSGSNYGLQLSAGSVLGLYKSTNTFHYTSVTISPWVQTTLVVRFGPASVRIKKLQGSSPAVEFTENPGYGAVSTGSSAPQLFSPLLGSGAYLSLTQAMVFGRHLTDEESSCIASWAHAQRCPEAFPVSSPLLAVFGDSIAAKATGWSALTLKGLRSAYPALELCNVAVAGSFTANLILSGPPTNIAQVADANANYSLSRLRNVAIIASGTNDLSGAVTAEEARDNVFSCGDQLRTAGWRVAFAPVLQRYLGNPAMQPTFDARRSAFNGYLSSGWSAHSNVPPVDISSLSGYLATDPAYFPDGTHPSDAMYALMNPFYQATAAALLA